MMNEVYLISFHLLLHIDFSFQIWRIGISLCNACIWPCIIYFIFYEVLRWIFSLLGVQDWQLSFLLIMAKVLIEAWLKQLIATLCSCFKLILSRRLQSGRHIFLVKSLLGLATFLKILLLINRACELIHELMQAILTSFWIFCHIRVTSMSQ